MIKRTRGGIQSTRRSERAWAACAAACLLALTGCVSDDPKRAGVGPPPKDSKPAVMWMGVNPPKDTNANGYPDSLVVTVYMFADNGYVRSISAPGTFDFKMIAKGGKLVKEWRVPTPGPGASAIKTAVGSGLLIGLSLLDDGGSDVMPYQSVEVLGSFTPKDGSAAVLASPNAVLVGRSAQ